LGIVVTCACAGRNARSKSRQRKGERSFVTFKANRP
jgi:hypothetical protein